MKGLRYTLASNRRIFQCWNKKRLNFHRKWKKDATAKSPDQKFWMDCKKDKIGNFERGCSQSNHRKVTDFGLLQDFKRMIMTFAVASNTHPKESFFIFTT